MRIVKAVVSKRKNEWGDYVVRAFGEDGRIPNADYYTSDKEDAEDTAKAMVKNGEEEQRI